MIPTVEKEFDCRICGKHIKFRHGWLSPESFLLTPELNDCCSEECFKKYNRKQELKAEKLKAKKEARFITKVAKEVIRLQEKDNG